MAANALVAEIRDRATSGLWRFTIAVPNEGGDSRAAERRLQATLSVLAEAGIDASGTVVEGDPFAAAELVTSEEDVHEIMLATYPTGQSAWMQADTVDRLRKSTGLGITRVVVSREEAREPLMQPGVTQVAVLADEALGGEGLVDALRQRSDERPIGVVLLHPMDLEVAGWTDEAEAVRNAAFERVRASIDAPAARPASRRAARCSTATPRPPRASRSPTTAPTRSWSSPRAAGASTRSRRSRRSRRRSARVPAEQIVVDAEAPASPSGS